MKIQINEKEIMKACSLDDESLEELVLEKLRYVVGEKITKEVSVIVKTQVAKRALEIKEKIEKHVEKVTKSYLQSSRFHDDVERMIINQMSDSIRMFRFNKS